MIPVILDFTDNDFTKAMEYINTHMIDHQEIAIDGHTINDMVTLGLMFEYIRIYGEDPQYAQKGIELCRSFPEEDRLPCIEGLSGGHMKYGEPGVEYIQNLTFCALPELTSDERESCYSYTLPRMGNRYDSETTKMICDQVPAVYRDKYCLL